ncbi:MAG: DUF2283 domain-containing protein [Cyclobacteriaceae bacterium]
MKIRYNKDLDILTIRFKEVPVAESDESKKGVILDYDENGAIVGIEILNASTEMPHPAQLDFAVEES